MKGAAIRSTCVRIPSRRGGGRKNCCAGPSGQLVSRSDGIMSWLTPFRSIGLHNSAIRGKLLELLRLWNRPFSR